MRLKPACCARLTTILHAVITAKAEVMVMVMGMDAGKTKAEGEAKAKGKAAEEGINSPFLKKVGGTPRRLA